MVKQMILLPNRALKLMYLTSNLFPQPLSEGRRLGQRKGAGNRGLQEIT